MTRKEISKQLNQLAQEVKQHDMTHNTYEYKDVYGMLMVLANAVERKMEKQMVTVITAGALSFINGTINKIKEEIDELREEDERRKENLN